MRYEQKFTEEELAKERWLPVVGWEGYYEVSDLGRVRTVARVTPRILRGRSSPLRVQSRIRKSHSSGPRWKEVNGGYPCMNLDRPGHNGKTVYVHHLVVEAFIGPRNGLEVNHLDGRKNNARLSNLELCTSSENKQHAKNVLGLMVGESAYQAKLRECDVRLIRSEYANGSSLTALARRFGVCPATVRDAATGRTWRRIA